LILDSEDKVDTLVYLIETNV